MSKGAPAVPISTANTKFNKLCIHGPQKWIQGWHTQNQHTRPHTIPPPAEDRLLHYASSTGLQEGEDLWKLGGKGTQQGVTVTVFFCMSSNHCQASYYLQGTFSGWPVKPHLSALEPLCLTRLSWGLHCADCQLVLPWGGLPVSTHTHVHSERHTTHTTTHTAHMGTRYA